MRRCRRYRAYGRVQRLTGDSDPFSTFQNTPSLLSMKLDGSSVGRGPVMCRQDAANATIPSGFGAGKCTRVQVRGRDGGGPIKKRRESRRGNRPRARNQERKKEKKREKRERERAKRETQGGGWGSARGRVGKKNRPTRPQAKK